MSSLFVFDGMNRPSFTIRIDVERATIADLFSVVADSYAMELNGRRNLRIIFADTELKYSRRKKLCDVGIINHSTIAIIFRLPDRHPAAPAAATTDDADVVEYEPVKKDEDAEYAKDVKADEENKDAREVKADEENKVALEVKADEENKDAKEVKADEENKDAKEVKADEENKDAKEVKADEENNDAKEVKADEENKDAKEVKADEENKDAKEVKADEENKDAKEVKADEENNDAKEVKADEENKDAKEVKADEENKDAKEVKADEENKDAKEVKTDEENKDAREVKDYEENKDAKEVKADEENKDVKEVKADEENKDAKEVKADEENKDAKEVKADEENNDAKEVKADEENKDAKEVKADEENKDAKEVKADEENKDVKEAKADEEKKFVNEVSVAESEQQIDEGTKDANEFSVAVKTGEAPPILEGTAIERSTNGGVETEENRPVLQPLPGVVELAVLPDLLNFDFDEERAILLPCCHVIGSETMRIWCQKQIDTGNTNVACPYTLLPFSPGNCPAVWKYRLVRHVACFTTKEMHDTEKAIAINFIGKDSVTLTCPRCFTWCSKMDPNMTRLRCFWCTREAGKEFLFCGYCLGEWKNARSGKCANPECRSIEKTLDILRESPMTNLYGGRWPVLRLCPRCGILTEFMGQCSHVHCQLCGYDYCFLCLKGAGSNAQLDCAIINFKSICQRASLQTSIPEWDGHNSD